MRRRCDLAYPPLKGAGRLALSAAKCETGWGDGLSTRTLSDVERPSPHLAARLARVDPPPPGEDKKRNRSMPFERHQRPYRNVHRAQFVGAAEIGQVDDEAGSDHVGADL